MLVGIGYDVHKFAPERKLILGGVEIPYPRGLAGYSDADVLIHAIIDAIIGALSLGDIGELFPDDDAQYKDISSLNLLSRIKQIIDKKDCQISHIDTIIILQEPKIKDFKHIMRENIASTLGIDLNQINIKAKTNEGLGFVGRKEGIAALAIAAIKRIK